MNDPVTEHQSIMYLSTWPQSMHSELLNYLINDYDAKCVCCPFNDKTKIC